MKASALIASDLDRTLIYSHRFFATTPHPRHVSKSTTAQPSPS